MLANCLASWLLALESVDSSLSQVPLFKTCNFLDAHVFLLVYNLDAVSSLFLSDTDRMQIQLFLGQPFFTINYIQYAPEVNLSDYISSNFKTANRHLLPCNLLSCFVYLNYHSMVNY